MINNVFWLSKPAANKPDSGIDVGRAMQTVPTQPKATGDAQSAQQAAQTQASSGRDTAKISPAGIELSKLLQPAKAPENIDLRKVERIKQQIADGQYPLDPGAVAARIVQFELLLNPPPGIQR
jgi:flagellar biosynthesis anti-sigma factor FlgM